MSLRDSVAEVLANLLQPAPVLCPNDEYGASNACVLMCTIRAVSATTIPERERAQLEQALSRLNEPSRVRIRLIEPSRRRPEGWSLRPGQRACVSTKLVAPSQQLGVDWVR